MAIDESVQRSVSPAGDPAWLVTGYHNVRSLLTDPRLSRWHPDPERAARFSGSAVFAQKADLETERRNNQQMRTLLGPAFSARGMERLRPRVQELLDGLLDDLAQMTPPVDLHQALSFPLPVLVICELLGVPFEDRDDFSRWSADFGYMDDPARSQAGILALWEYMGKLVEHKRQAPGDDVISSLVAMMDKDPEAMSPERVAFLGAALLFAGHETTVVAIDRGVVLLMTNEDERAALLRDPDVAARAVEEILRMPDPVHGARSGDQYGLARYANTDLEIDGVTIPAGDLVMLSVREANLDERAFPDAQTFDVTRQASSNHLGFGFGAHFCLGAPLARLELQTVFGTLLRRFPTLRLAVPVEELRPREGMVTGGLQALPVTW